MGKKLMEIIELKKKLKTGKASIKLLDTGFSQLTRKIGSETGADYLTIADGDILSKEALVSLNQKQLELKGRYETIISAYNSWIDGKKSDITGLSNFTYNFSAVTDYSSGYEAGITSADYYMLTEIVNAEKELYELGNFWFLNHLKDNIEIIKEWSKTKNYLSTVDYISVFGETQRGVKNWKVMSKTHSVTVTFVSTSSDKINFRVSDLDQITEGETCTITLGAKVEETAHLDDGGSYSYSYYEQAYMYITRTALTGGDSTFSTSYNKGGFDDHLYQTGISYNGNTATHFDTDSPSFPWLQGRTYL